MKICIVSFSGRRNANCGSIAMELCGLYGNEAEVYDFSSLKITPCTGCGYECFEAGENALTLRIRCLKFMTVLLKAT